jgi:hypothetical protein
MTGTEVPLKAAQVAKLVKSQAGRVATPKVVRRHWTSSNTRTKSSFRIDLWKCGRPSSAILDASGKTMPHSPLSVTAPSLALEQSLANFASTPRV